MMILYEGSDPKVYLIILRRVSNVVPKTSNKSTYS